MWDGARGTRRSARASGASTLEPMELLPNVVFLPFLLLAGIVTVAVIGFFVSTLTRKRTP